MDISVLGGFATRHAGLGSRVEADGGVRLGFAPLPVQLAVPESAVLELPRVHARVHRLLPGLASLKVWYKKVTIMFEGQGTSEPLQQLGGGLICMLFEPSCSPQCLGHFWKAALWC